MDEEETTIMPKQRLRNERYQFRQELGTAKLVGILLIYMFLVGIVAFIIVMYFKEIHQ